MIRTQINLTEEQYRSLKSRARKESKSLSALIRQMVERQAKRRRNNAGVLLDMAKRAGRSGQKNLARDYKKYLY